MTKFDTKMRQKSTVPHVSKEEKHDIHNNIQSSIRLCNKNAKP